MNDNASKYTPEKGALVCEDIRRGFPVEYACMSVGVTAPTIYNWRNQHPEFDVMYRDAIHDLLKGPMDCLHKAAQHDPDSALKYLSRRLPKYFGTFEKWAGSWNDTDKPTTSDQKLSGDELTAALEEDDRIKKGK